MSAILSCICLLEPTGTVIPTYGGGIRGFVQHVRIQINAIRPDDGARGMIHRYLGKEGRVLEGPEHAPSARRWTGLGQPPRGSHP